MGFFTDWLDRQFKASWERSQRTDKLNRAYAPLAVSEDDRMVSKTFTVREALNGQYIEFRKHQYNPSGPNFNEQCVYIVRDDETLIDAISVVLVLMNKES